MQHSEFRIGGEFTTSVGRFRCTDIGARTIIAIRVDKVTVATHTPGDDTTQRDLTGDEAEKDGWFNGPPYAVLEHIFDEDSISNCAPVPTTSVARP